MIISRKTLRAASKAARPQEFKPVRRGALIAVERFWSRHRAWRVAEWGNQYLALTANGHLFLCQTNGLAVEVTAKPGTLRALFESYPGWEKVKVSA